MTEPPTIYRITLRALSSDTTPTNRLKRLLKSALRQYGFRCTDIETLSDGLVERVEQEQKQEPSASDAAAS